MKNISVSRLPSHAQINSTVSRKLVTIILSWTWQLVFVQKTSEAEVIRFPIESYQARENLSLIVVKLKFSKTHLAIPCGLFARDYEFKILWLVEIKFIIKPLNKLFLFLDLENFAGSVCFYAIGRSFTIRLVRKEKISILINLRNQKFLIRIM